MWSNRTPSEMIKELNPARYEELNTVAPMIYAFTIFSQAEYLGLSFSPKEIDIDTLNHFSVIKMKMEEIEHGKRPKADIRPPNRKRLG